MAKVRPNDPRSYVVLGRLLLFLVWCRERDLLTEETPSLENMRSELAQAARMALKLGPEDPFVAGFWSKALVAEGKYAEAAEAERRAFALDRRKGISDSGSNRSDWEGPPRPAPGSLWKGEECEDGYFEVLGRVLDPDISSPGSSEWGLGVSTDGRQLFFGSSRPGGAGGKDIYVASWDETRGAFSSVRRLIGANSEFWDAGPSISRDGQTLYFQTDRPVNGAAIGTHFASATWDPDARDFTAVEDWPDFRVVPKEGWMGALSISFDDLELFFGAKPEFGNVGGQDLYVAWRDSVKERFSLKRCRPLQEINSPFDDMCPCASKDGKTIFWTGFLTDSHAGSHGQELLRSSVWMAERPRLRNFETGEPEQFREIRWVRIEPEMSVVHLRITGEWPEDGARAYFISALPGGSSVRQDFDIYAAVWRRARR